MILDEQYAEDVYNKEAGRDLTLIEQVYKSYGRPKTIVLEIDEDIARAVYTGYIELKHGTNAAWDALNAKYMLGKQSRFMGISYTIVNKLKTEFDNHKYFAGKTPTEDDFQEVLLKVLTYLSKTNFEYNAKFPGLLLVLVRDMCKQHLRNTMRLENRGLGKAVIYLHNLDGLQQTQENQADTELNESDSFDRVRQADFDYDGEAFCRNSPETPEEAYEKAQMAAW